MLSLMAGEKSDCKIQTFVLENCLLAWPVEQNQKDVPSASFLKLPVALSFWQHAVSHNPIKCLMTYINEETPST